MFVSVVKDMESRGKFKVILPDSVSGAEFLNDYLNEKLGEKESIEKIISISRMSEKELESYLSNKRAEKIRGAEKAEKKLRANLLAKPKLSIG